MREKVAIFIDGSNFYHYLKDIGFKSAKGFDFKKFSDFLIGDRDCVFKGYYTGIFRNTDGTPKSVSLVRGQQKFLSHLENVGFVIKRGRIMYDGGRPREKGTDVKIAVELVVDAVDNKYDTAIVISSDTDLIPALEYVRKNKKKKVEYVGFSNAPSFGMQKNADISRLLLLADLDNFQIV